MFDTIKLQDDPTSGQHKVCRAYTTLEHRYARQDHKLFELFEAVKEPDYQKVVATVREDAMVKKLPTEHPAREYIHVIDGLSIIDKEEDPLLVLNDSRIVVPRGAQKEVLKKLHIAHLGIRKTIAMASERYYWPRMKCDIEKMVKSCNSCRKYMASQVADPMIKIDIMLMKNLSLLQEMGTDLFNYLGKHYLILVDTTHHSPSTRC
jgi:hypothetical protein